MRAERCGNCRFSRLVGVDQRAGQSWEEFRDMARAHGYDEAAVHLICAQDSPRGQGYWPAVADDAWCGRYEEGPELRRVREIERLERELRLASLSHPEIVPLIKQQIASLKANVEIGERVPA